MKSINATETHLHLIIDDNAYRIRWEGCSPKLAHASLPQKKRVEVAPSGYGIHWPELDEDLAITPLLKHAESLDTNPREVGLARDETMTTEYTLGASLTSPILL